MLQKSGGKEFIKFQFQFQNIFVFTLDFLNSFCCNFVMQQKEEAKSMWQKLKIKSLINYNINGVNADFICSHAMCLHYSMYARAINVGNSCTEFL